MFLKSKKRTLVAIYRLHPVWNNEDGFVVKHFFLGPTACFAAFASCSSFMSFSEDVACFLVQLVVLQENSFVLALVVVLLLVVLLAKG
jgi:hypothetical protein